MQTDGRGLKRKAYTVECRRCGRVFDYIGVEDWPGLGPVYCEECEAGVFKAQDRERASHVSTALRSSLLSASGIPDSLQDWDAKKGNNRLLAWVRQHNDSSLFIAGRNGVCKTRAVARVGVELIDRRRESVLFVRVPAWLRRVGMELARNEGRKAESMIAEAKRVGVLVLDDFGKEKLTDRAGETLFDIIDERERDGRRLWITSNLGGPALVKKIGGDTGDRGVAIHTRLKRVCVSPPQEILVPPEEVPELRQPYKD